MQQEIRKLRSRVLYEALRYVFDAYILLINELPLSREEEKLYGQRALKAAGEIDWETYTTTRQSFLNGADELLLAVKDRIPWEERMILRNRIMNPVKPGVTERSCLHDDLEGDVENGCGKCRSECPCCHEYLHVTGHAIWD